jgi:hypothetical protein
MKTTACGKRVTLPTFKLPARDVGGEAPTRAAGGFDFPVQQVGSTPDSVVYYDPSLGAAGLQLGQAILAAMPGLYQSCRSWFGIQGARSNVILAAIGGATDGSQGAYHYGCSFSSGGDLYEDAALGNPALTTGLVMAELSECFMGDQGRGWDCGGSNGEALSRVMAEQASGGPGGALGAFMTAPAWPQAGYPDWVGTTESTDQDPVSIGCGVLYLYWMMSQGYGLDQITQAGGATLALNYSALTGKTTAYPDLVAAVKALPGGVTSDDPWQGSTPPAPPPTPPPAPPPAGPTAASVVKAVNDMLKQKHKGLVKQHPGAVKDIDDTITAQFPGG